MGASGEGLGCGMETAAAGRFARTVGFFGLRTAFFDCFTEALCGFALARNFFGLGRGLDFKAFIAAFAAFRACFATFLACLNAFRACLCSALSIRRCFRALSTSFSAKADLAMRAWGLPSDFRLDFLFFIDRLPVMGQSQGIGQRSLSAQIEWERVGRTVGLMQAPDCDF